MQHISLENTECILDIFILLNVGFNSLVKSASKDLSTYANILTTQILNTNSQLRN